MNYKKPFKHCQDFREKPKRYASLADFFADSASECSAGGGLARKKPAYLTNTDKLDSTQPLTPVIHETKNPQNNTHELTDIEKNHQLYEQKSYELFKNTKKLLNHDKNALRQIHALGFNRCRKINSDTIVIYANFNRLGNSTAGFALAQQDSNTDKARMASRQLAYERALANSDIWAYFATITFDATKQDRNDFELLRQRFTNFLRRKGVRYFFVPELHKKGGIHFHALLSKDIEPYLSEFSETAPKALKNRYIAKKISDGVPIKNCASIAETYGYCIIEPIRDVDSCIHYMTKYVLKTFDDENFTRISRRRFFISKGLKSPKIVLPHRIDLENFDLVALSSHTEKIYLKRSTKAKKPLASMSEKSSRFPFSSRLGSPPFPLKQPEKPNALL